MSRRYKTEAEFVRYLSGKLKKEHADVQRLESHTTGVGIPDMFIQGYGEDLFVEVKNVPNKTLNDSFKIPWRPGQIAWFYRYVLAHRCVKCGYTICAVADGVIIFKMTEDMIAVANWNNDFSFLKKDCWKDVTCFNWKQFTQLKLFKFLITEK